MGPEFSQIKPWLEQTWGKIREKHLRNAHERVAQSFESLAARGLAQSGAALRSDEEATWDSVERTAADWLQAMVRIAKETYGRRSLEFLTDARTFYVTNCKAFESGANAHLAEVFTRAGIPYGQRKLFAFERDFNVEFGLDLIKAQQMSEPPKRSGSDGFTFDVFISHASEDKPVATEIANGLEARGFTVWMDSQQITIGDSIFKKVNDGLARSRYGVVLLSARFFEKGWTKEELAALAGRAYDGNTKVILPVRLDLTPQAVAQAAPLLGGILSGTCDDMEILLDGLTAAMTPSTT
jgi:hypothetical protein